MPNVFNRAFYEGSDFVPIFLQQDANNDILGTWVSMINYVKCYVILTKAGSESVGNLGLQLLQAQDATGTGAKSIYVPGCRYKSGTLSTTGIWVSNGFTAPADFLGFGATTPGGVTYPTTNNVQAVPNVGTGQMMLSASILETDLDCANGFKYITAHIEGDNVNATCLLTGQVILYAGKRDEKVPPNPLT